MMRKPPPDHEPVYIFLDMDGVVADFDRHAREHGKYGPDGNIREEALDFAWWSSMPVFEGAKGFYTKLRDLGRVKFLTGPKLSPDCYAGKADWLERKFLPERGKWALMDLLITPSRDKFLIAGPGRILVDDRLSNVMAWQQAGGIGILHSGDFNETLEKVRQAVAGLRPPAAPRRPRDVPPAP